MRLTQPARDKGRAAHLDKSDLHLSKSGSKFFRDLNPSSAVLKGNTDCGSDLAKLLTKNISLF